MAAFTASQASIYNGSKVVKINSGESIANVGDGDFLVIANFIVEINRAYVSATNEQLIELVENWPNSNQNNQKCIVIPTTGAFKKAVDALTNANLLVNNNFTAMQDWQTKTGSVTFTNQDGTTTTVKTLKQIENEAQAQLDEYHPYPWAMRKVEFEAIRAINDEKLEAGGFVRFGKHYSGTSPNEKPINQGLNTSLTEPNILRMGRGGEASKAGTSKADLPVINIAGVSSVLDGICYPSSTLARISKVKLPEAEDGTRTYDSSTGISVKHATPDIAFASETTSNKVVTDRVDVWGFEAFLRQINDNDPFVYKNGLIQSLVTDIEGVPTVNDTIRPITYFAWFEGDTTSRGKGVNWQTATEQERKAIASNPDNNIFFDDSTGLFYQWCIRGRSFAGAGNGDWLNIDSTDNGIGYGAFRFDSESRVQAQGIKDTVDSFAGDTSSQYRWPEYALKQIPYKGIGHVVSGEHSVRNQCFFLVCGTVNRLNKGGYHPSFNPSGAAGYIADGTGNPRPWDHENIKNSGLVSSRLSCFDFGPIVGASIGQVAPDTGSLESSKPLPYKSGRPDVRFYDGIEVGGEGGVCRDMRYSSKGVSIDDLYSEKRKCISSKARGLAAKVRTQIIKGDDGSTTSSGEFYFSRASGAYSGAIYHTGFLSDAQIGDIVTVVDGGGVVQTMIIQEIQAANKIGVFSLQPWSFPDGQGGTTQNLGNTYLVKTVKQNHSISGTSLRVDVYGHPSEILKCSDLANGWYGGFILNIPDGLTNSFITTKRKVDDATYSFTRLHTVDEGVTWTLTTPSVEIPTKGVVDNGAPANRVGIVRYPFEADLTSQATISDVSDEVLGGIHVTDSHLVIRGSSLAESFGIDLTSSQSSHTEDLAKTNTPLLNNEFVAGFEVEHVPLGLRAPSGDTSAVKFLTYPSKENDMVCLNFAYTELKHNGTDWGDDSKINMASGQYSMFDENGRRVRVGTNITQPLGWIKNDK